MSDRASSKPKYTSYELDNEDDDQDPDTTTAATDDKSVSDLSGEVDYGLSGEVDDGETSFGTKRTASTKKSKRPTKKKNMSPVADDETVSALN